MRLSAEQLERLHHDLSVFGAAQVVVAALAWGIRVSLLDDGEWPIGDPYLVDVRGETPHVNGV